MVSTAQYWLVASPKSKKMCYHASAPSILVSRHFACLSCPTSMPVLKKTHAYVSLTVFMFPPPTKVFLMEEIPNLKQIYDVNYQ